MNFRTLRLYPRSKTFLPPCWGYSYYYLLSYLFTTSYYQCIDFYEFVFGTFTKIPAHKTSLSRSESPLLSLQTLKPVHITATVRNTKSRNCFENAFLLLLIVVRHCQNSITHPTSHQSIQTFIISKYNTVQDVAQP